MRVCPVCRQALAGTGWDCNGCGYRAVSSAGFITLAPELSRQAEGFDPGLFAGLAALEARNFWFRARNRLIVWALQRYFPQISKFMEVGCGTGFVLEGVSAAFPAAALWATEAQTEGLAYAAQRVPRAQFVQMDARDMPFEGEFDIVGAFDVIEHITEDERVLQQMYRAVRPGGGVVLTVPQHPCLWSEYDVRAHHVRRYTAAALRHKLARCGFGIVRMTSFVSLLLPLMLLSRRAQRTPRADYDPLAELRISPLPNAVLERVLDAERLLIRAGVSLPVGGSLLAIARRPA